MTVPALTQDGILIQTFAQVFNELADGYRAIYGNDINLDQESPDGQRVGIEARERVDMQGLALSIYNSLDPDLATGLSLNRLLKLTGLFLRPATRSQADLEINMEFATTLSAGYTVRDSLGQNWITTQDNSVSAGLNTVTVFAEDFGQVEADAGTITEPVTIVLGVISVTNLAAADAGQDEETEEEVRLRRRSSLELPAYSTTGSLFARLANTANVTDVAVYENATTATVNTIPAHSLWIVIEGGDVEDIAEVIAKNKTGGTGLKGTIEEDYIETVQRPDGTTFTIVHTMKFDRPTDVPLTIVVDAAKKQPTDVINATAIKEEIAKKAYQINEPALASELYAFGYNAGTNFILTDLTIDKGTGATEGQLTNDLDERFTIDTVDITVNLI